MTCPNGLEQGDDSQQMGYRSRHVVVPATPAARLGVKLCPSSSWWHAQITAARAGGQGHLSESPPIPSPILPYNLPHQTPLNRNIGTKLKHPNAEHAALWLQSSPQVQKTIAVHGHTAAGKYTANRLVLWLSTLHSAGSVYCVWHGTFGKKKKKAQYGTWSLFSFRSLKAKAREGEGGGEAPFQ